MYPTIPVAPVRPIAAYLGGKRNLAKRLCAIIDGHQHRTYVEPFVGMGGIFLRRSRRPTAEVINDLSGDVANLFRIVRRHYQPFVDELTGMHASRAEFERQVRLDPGALTDIERAVRFLYLQRLAFGGKVEGRSFGVSRGVGSRFNLAKLRADLRALNHRLEPVVIEQLDYAVVIRRYDSRDTLFYLDPPYDGTEGYGLAFGHDHYLRLAEQLGEIAGDFIMSINDTPFIRDAFARFAIEEVSTTWSVSQTVSKPVSELIIRNRR
ncbi:DNA adenine methylase [Sphingomonas zeae]